MQSAALGDGRDRRALKMAGVLYATGTAIHTVDHFRRGAGSVSWEVVEIGTVGTVLAAIALTLIFTEHRLAPHFAIAVGFPHGLGIAAVHWLPHWSVLSDSFWTAGAPAISWIAVSLEVAGALAVGFAGLSIYRRGLAHEASRRVVTLDEFA